MSRLYQKILEFNEKYPHFYCIGAKRFLAMQKVPLIPYGSQRRKLIEISKDGFSFLDQGRYAIFINERNPETRQKFTIAHEIGHIYLGHHEALSAHALSYNSPQHSIQRWETEANIFARNILIPVDAARRWMRRRKKEKATVFGISEEAVRLRYLYLEKDMRSLAIARSSEHQKNKEHMF